MKRIIVSVALFIVLTFSIFASNMHEIIPLNSGFYNDIDALYLMSGNGTPSNARPWSKSEALLILNRITYEHLTPLQKRVYTGLYEQVTSNPFLYDRDDFGFGFGFDLNAELYWHSNGEQFFIEQDWVYDFVRRKPLLRLRFDFGLSDFGYIYSDLQYGRNLANANDLTKDFSQDGVGAIVEKGAPGVRTIHSAIYSRSFLTNMLPFNESYDIDFETPKRAVFSFGGDHWNVNISRDKVSWGNGHSGNFIVDDHVDFHEFARFKFFSEHFSYDWLNIFFPTRTSTGEVPDQSIRLLMAHRLEFRLWNFLTFALSENVMYSNDLIDFRYLNPAFIYHNLNNTSMFNAIAHLEMDVMVSKGLNLYGQYVLDQARAPNEPDTQADATGFLAGMEYVVEVGPGFLSTSLEAAVTSPVLYRRSYVDFLMFRPYFTHGNPSGPGYVLDFDFIGYKHGSDVQVLQWDVNYSTLSHVDVGLSIIGLREGKIDIFYSNEGITAYEGATPSGPEVRESLIISLNGTYDFPKLFNSLLQISLWGELDWVGRRTFVKASGMYKDYSNDVQLTMGVGISL